MKKCFFAVVMLALSTMVGNVFAYQDVDPDKAYEMVASGMAASDMVAAQKGVYILDVRTPEECIWVGCPGVNKLGEGAELEGFVVNVAYKKYIKGMLVVNPSFVEDVKEVLGEETVIITMCRSGARSVAAAEALEAAGFSKVYNMVTGFEGEKDSAGYRTVNGWKNSLPYNYSASSIYKD